VRALVNQKATTAHEVYDFQAHMML